MIPEIFVNRNSEFTFVSFSSSHSLLYNTYTKLGPNLLAYLKYFETEINSFFNFILVNFLVRKIQFTKTPILYVFVHKNLKKTALKSFVKLKSFIIEIQLCAFESPYYSGTPLVFSFQSFISKLICIFPALF